MLKLTTIHIEEIRKYFLATSGEEQLMIQKKIMPSYLWGFLPQLKQLFNGAVADEIELVSIAKSMGAEDHLEILKEIRLDYYINLAQMYNSGVSNLDIETLVRAGNRDFLQELDFQKEIKAAFQLDERAAFKKKFQQLDKEQDIDADEMSQTFKLIERQKLKEQFQKLEEENTSTKKPATVIKLKWRPIAIAASIAGFLAITGYIFILANRKQENIRIANNREKQISLFGKDNKLNDSIRVYEIKEQREIGFTNSKKTDSIKVIVRDVIAMADLINFKSSFLINKFDSGGATQPAAKNNRHELDSLKSLQEYLKLINNTYSYTVETKTITLNVSSNDSLISVYRYSATGKQPDLYIKYKGIFYKIDKQNTPMSLNELNDKNLVETLERI